MFMVSANSPCTGMHALQTRVTRRLCSSSTSSCPTIKAGSVEHYDGKCSFELMNPTTGSFKRRFIHTHPDAAGLGRTHHHHHQQQQHGELFQYRLIKLQDVYKKKNEKGLTTTITHKTELKIIPFKRSFWVSLPAEIGRTRTWIRGWIPSPW